MALLTLAVILIATFVGGNDDTTRRRIMPNPDALWQDIQKLDDLYEELLWDPDDELQFTHDGKGSHHY